MRVALVTRELHPFVGGGLGNYVSATAEALAPVAEVVIFTRAAYRERYEELLRAADPRLWSERVVLEFVDDEPSRGGDGYLNASHRWSARAWEALRRRYGAHGPDIVEFPDYHAEGLVAAQAAACDDSFLRRTKVCVRAYTTLEMCDVLDGCLPGDVERRVLYDMERYALRHADAFVWPGGDVLGAFRRFYGERGVAPAHLARHAFLEPGHDTGPGSERAALTAGVGSRAERSVSPVQPAPRQGGPAVRLLYVGRLERRKGVADLVSAAQSLTHDDWTLTLAGGNTGTGPSGTRMSDVIALSAAGSPRIRWLGPVPRDEVFGLVDDCDLIVLPSLWECWPNTALEAMARDCPILATPTGGYCELVEAGRTGWLAPPGVASLADALERRCDHPEEAAEIRRSGRVAERFSALTDPDGVRESYLELAAAPGRRARRRRRPSARIPLVSVVVPYHRAADTVQATLDSALAQTHRNLELVVVDDGSFAPGDEVLDRLEERGPVRVAAQVNGGLGAARNAGVALARGRYVLPLDADDLIHPTYVERLVEVLESRPEVAYACSWSRYVDGDGEGIGAQDNGWSPISNELGALEAVNVAGHASALLRRRLFSLGFRYPDELTSYEDWTLYATLADAGHLGHVVPERLFLYRIRERSMLRALGLRRQERLLSELRARRAEEEMVWTSMSV